MKKFSLCLFLFVLFQNTVEAACTDANADGINGTFTAKGDAIVYSGSCTLDNEVLIQTTDTVEYDACFVHSTTGSVDVFVSLDGNTYTTVAVALTDENNTTPTLSAATTAGTPYSFAAKFWRIRVQQAGATAAAAVLVCWDYSN